MLLLLLTGCSLAPVYTDPDTGELVADAARISLLKKSSVKTIYSTSTNVFYLMNNASVLASGCNDKGLLGQGNTNAYDYVVQVKLSERIKLISANDSFAAAVSDTNNIYIWGDLSWWDSDTITVTDENFAYRKFSFDEIITDISVSENHIAVLSKKGNVYTLGYNYGQLGYDCTAYNQGQLYNEFRRAETDQFISKIETNPTATYMISSNGQLFGCSFNTFYELGYMDTILDVNQIQANAAFTALTTAGHNLFALSSAGDVYVCGQNSYGVLGLNSTLASAAALTRIPFGKDIKIKNIYGCDYNNTVFFISEDNDIYACGANSDNSLLTEDTGSAVLAPSKVKIGKVSAFYGMGTTMFYIDASDHLYTYGDNSYGQMPITTSSGNSKFVSPVRIYANVK